MKKIANKKLDLEIPSVLGDLVEQYQRRYCEENNILELNTHFQDDFVRILSRVWACSDFVAEYCINESHRFQDLVASGDLLVEFQENEYQFKSNFIRWRFRRCRI